MKKIAFFGNALLDRKGSGTSVVAVRTLNVLLKTNFQIYIICKNSYEKTALENKFSSKNVYFVILPKVRTKYFSGFFQYLLFSRKTDLVFDLLFFSVPRMYPLYWNFPAKKFVCFFHAAGDISAAKDKFILSTHVYNWVAKLFWHKLAAIVAVSQDARNEIHNYYRIPLSAIRIIPLGADSFLNLSSSKIPIKNGFSKKSLKIVVAGRWQGFKNVAEAIKAVHEFSKLNKCEVVQILVGKSNTLGSDSVKNVIRSIRDLNYIHFEHLSAQELNWLFKYSDLYLVPSLNEGFGLPAFEAFAGGSKLLIHNKTPASTILGDFHGVYPCDMSKRIEIIKTIEFALADNLDVDVRQRRLFLSNYKLTWKDFDSKILLLFQDLLWY